MTIVVRNWERFQHRDVVRAKHGRAPVWIKVYTELLSDEAFLSLTEHRRLVLLCLWLEYARTRARLPLDTRSLSLRLNARVTAADLQALKASGFIEYDGDARTRDATRAVARRSRSGHDLFTTRSRPVRETVAATAESPNHAEPEEYRPADSQQAAGLEERREEQEQERGSSNVTLDADENQQEEPHDELAQRRTARAAVNDRPNAFTDFVDQLHEQQGRG